MGLVELPEWAIWRDGRLGDRARRNEARDMLSKRVGPDAVSELLSSTTGASLPDAEAAARLLFHWFAEEVLPLEWHGRFADALRSLIRRLDYRSALWSACHGYLDSVLDTAQVFLAEDLHERGLSMDQYLADLAGGARQLNAGARASAETPSVGEALDALQNLGVAPPPPMRAQIAAWADSWRQHRSGQALFQIYEHFISGLPESRVPLKALVNLLGSPSHQESSFVYYARSSDAGLVLQGDENGFLSGRKMN